MFGVRLRLIIRDRRPWASITTTRRMPAARAGCGAIVAVE